MGDLRADGDEVGGGRVETDCQCPSGDECPCEADGPDGLCACCRPNGEHDGTCAGQVAGS